MRGVRVLAVARKALRSLKHDRRTAGFLVLMPLFMIAIFGYTFGGELRNIDVIVVNLDATPSDLSVSERIVSSLVEDETLRVAIAHGGDATTYSVARVHDGEAWAAIVFGGGFTETVAAWASGGGGGTLPDAAVVTIYLDGTNPNIAQAVTAAVRSAIQETLTVGYNVTSPVEVQVDMVYGEDAEFIDFFAPGVMGLAAMMATFMLSIISFVHERSTGTLDRLLTTPVTEGEIVAGYALAFGFVALVQSTVILTAALVLFGVQVQGSVLLVLLVILALGVGSQGMGFLLSSIARNEFQAIQFMPVILFPSILLAGVFWPLEAVPDLLRPVSYFIPLTYAVDGCRSVMIRGWGIEEVWLQLLILAAFAAAMLVLSAYSLKRRR
jgi:ABC-2 type transport system permease protein